MNPKALRVQQRVIEAWDEAILGLQRMNQAALIRPTTAYEVFEIDATASNDVVKLNVKPAVFFVPERPNRRRPDLYIVVQGWLSFAGPEFTTVPFNTADFGTEVAYFRTKTGALEHVYGAHYDMDERRAGHPVFHAQFGSQLTFGEAVRSQFRLDDALVDMMGTVLSTVRVPSAQMDVFSVITQIGADHLMGEASGPEVKGAFRRLRASCDFLIGAASRMGFLNTDPAIHCYRATHWYDSPAANI